MVRGTEQAARMLMHAKTRADACEDSLANEPFWRFRRRAALKRRARRARSAEASLLEVVQGAEKPPKK
jgi:hypothetical protein